MKALLLLSFLLAFPAWGQLQAEPAGEARLVPGEPVQVRLKLLDPALLERVSPSRLKAAAVPRVLWFMHVDPWEVGESASAGATVVIGPEFRPDQEVRLRLPGGETTLRFKGFAFSPSTEKPEGDYAYQDVPWYERPWWRRAPLLAGLALLLGTALFFGKTAWHRRRARLARQRAREAWLGRLREASDIPALSKVWGERDALLADFPEAEAPIRGFFEVLNLHQFKPRPDQAGADEVARAKARLMERLSGGGGVGA